MLLVDNREPPKLRKAILEKVIDAEEVELDYGDFVLLDTDGHSLAIERKSIQDLLNSLAQGKMKRQLGNLSNYTEGVLLVEGHWSVAEDGTMLIWGRQTGWKVQSVQMLLLGLQWSTGVRLLWTSGRDETVRVLRTLAARASDGCVLVKKGAQYGEEANT